MHRAASVDPNLDSFLRDWDKGSQYPNTKLANVLFTYEAQRRLGTEGIQVSFDHPHHLASTHTALGNAIPCWYHTIPRQKNQRACTQDCVHLPVSGEFCTWRVERMMTHIVLHRVSASVDVTDANMNEGSGAVFCTHTQTAALTKM